MAVVVVMVSSTPCGVVVVVVMVSSTPCCVAVVLVMVVVMGIDYKASLSNPGSKIQGSGVGDPKMRVLDGRISATTPHLLTHWRVQQVSLGKAVTVSIFER